LIHFYKRVFKMGSSRLSASIYLFRNDLRLLDNECFNLAHRLSSFVIPVYCFDPDHYKPTWHFKFKKTEKFRGQFLLESVADIRARLRQQNSDLIIYSDHPHKAIKDIISRCGAGNIDVTSVVYQKEVTFEEVNVESQIKDICQHSNVQVHEIWGSTLYNLQDLPFKINRVPDTYTQFRKEVESRARVRPVLQDPKELKPLPVNVDLPRQDIPSLSQLGIKELDTHHDKRSAFPFQGGETSGLARLKSYLWGSNAVATYKDTRNGLVGTEYSTKFSPWLALGCVSPRTIHREIKRYEKEVVANNSTYWVLFELIWRDYFKFVCLKYGDRVFFRTGIMGRDQEWSQNMSKFRLWAEGRTGVPFVDANMRELKETGWMSNRGRQNVASYLIKDMGLDWRLGAEWFESYLLDHDVCSNYGNWNYAAGIGNDPRENRKFNMIKQGMDYDGDGEFVRMWVPEIARIPGGKIHVPWTLSSKELDNAGVSLGENYPKPVVLAPEWGRHTQKSNKKPGYRDSNPKGGRGGGQQRGIDFYFKSDRGGQEAAGGGKGSGGRGGGGHRGLPRGGRVQR